MDIKDQLVVLSNKIGKTRDQILTEEACKSAYVMPFLNLLGYDVFNPLEVVPEFNADVGIKKGEKVDYAIFKENELILLIECKGCNDELTNHDTQLFRYFSVTKAKFAILTNGIIYKFFTDLEELNKMDEKPFLEIDLLDLKDNLIPEIKKFHKQAFNIDDVLSSASELKYVKEIKSLLMKEFHAPGEKFVKLFASQAQSNKLTQQVVEKFTQLTKKAFSQMVSDMINERLQSAIVKEAEQNEIIQQQQEPVEIIENKAVVTIQELEGFAIVKSILFNQIDLNRINYRDYANHFTIHLDTNYQKIICKLVLTDKESSIIIKNEEKKDIKYQINSVNEIYAYSDQLIKTLNSLILNNAVEVSSVQ